MMNKNKVTTMAINLLRREKRKRADSATQRK